MKIKETPILYSTYMVQAILAGRKTQTRRVIKTPKHKNAAGFQIVSDVDKTVFWPEAIDENERSLEGDGCNMTCPYGKPGDVLWVREEHLITISPDNWITVQFKDGYTFKIYFKELSLRLVERLYKRKSLGKWQRARFLPKELARIWLRITDIRVERLHVISEDDAIAEGVEKQFTPLFQEWRYKDYFNTNSDWRSPISSFQSLWKYINGEDSWAANPWVWVVEFDVVSTTGRTNVKEVRS